MRDGETGLLGWEDRRASLEEPGGVFDEELGGRTGVVTPSLKRRSGSPWASRAGEESFSGLGRTRGLRLRVVAVFLGEDFFLDLLSLDGESSSSSSLEVSGEESLRELYGDLGRAFAHRDFLDDLKAFGDRRERDVIDEAGVRGAETLSDFGDVKGAAGAATMARAAAAALALADSRVLMLWRDSGEESEASCVLGGGCGMRCGEFYL